MGLHGHPISGKHQGFFLASEFLSLQVRVVPSKNTPIKVNPSFTLQPKKKNPSISSTVQYLVTLVLIDSTPKIP
jgi:hypothetical protein